MNNYAEVYNENGEYIGHYQMSYNELVDFGFTDVEINALFSED